MELSIVAVVAIVAIVAVVALYSRGGVGQAEPAVAQSAPEDRRLAYARKFGRAPDHLNTGRAW